MRALVLAVFAALMVFGGEARAAAPCTPFTSFPLVLNFGSGANSGSGEDLNCAMRKVQAAINTLPSLVSDRAQTNAELAATLPIVGVIQRTGFATAGDGGRATYVYGSAACTIAGGDGGSQIVSNFGGCWNIDWSSVNGEATPELFGGAVGFTVDGSPSAPDAQPAIQKALDTRKPVRLNAPFYRLNRAAVITTPGQDIAGRGQNATALVFYPGYDVSNGSGVLTLSRAVFAATRALGPSVRDLRIKGFQPEVNPAQTDGQQIATLIQTSCIDARGGYGAKFTGLVLTSCMRGLDLRGDVGQVVIDDLKGSNFTTDIELDGDLDTVRISKHHNFPTNVTANQAALMLRVAIAIRSGRMDDLKVSDSMCIAARICFYAYQGTTKTIANDGYASPGGVTSAAFINYNFDIVQLGWQIDAGAATFVGGYYASTAGGSVTGGGIAVVTAPVIINMNSDKFFTVAGNGAFTLTNAAAISDNNTDATFVYQGGGQVILANNNYGWNPTASKDITKPKVWSAAGTMVAQNNLVQTKGPGAQAAGAGFFRVDNDNTANVIANNSTQGWNNNYPPAIRGIYAQNSGEIPVRTYPLYSEVTGANAASTSIGKSFTIRDAAGDFTYGGVAAGGGARVGRIMSDGANWRYF